VIKLPMGRADASPPVIRGASLLQLEPLREPLDGELVPGCSRTRTPRASSVLEQLRQIGEFIAPLGAGPAEKLATQA
jgi:hypothetical protein